MVPPGAYGQLTDDLPPFLRQNTLRRDGIVLKETTELGELPFNLLTNGIGNHEMATRDSKLHNGGGEIQYNTLRWLDVGIFSSSRYFAIVRRARTSPSFCSIVMIFESLSGRL